MRKLKTLPESCSLIGIGFWDKTEISGNSLFYTWSNLFLTIASKITWRWKGDKNELLSARPSSGQTLKSQVAVSEAVNGCEVCTTRWSNVTKKGKKEMVKVEGISPPKVRRYMSWRELHGTNQGKLTFLLHAIVYLLHTPNLTIWGKVVNISFKQCRASLCTMKHSFIRCLKAHEDIDIK